MPEPETYTYVTVGLSKFYIKDGFYSIAELEQILSDFKQADIRRNKRLGQSMKNTVEWFAPKNLAVSTVDGMPGYVCPVCHGFITILEYERQKCPTCTMVKKGKEPTNAR